jgi:RNA polymerase sigma-70 factor (ECF subfamily)
MVYGAKDIIGVPVGPPSGAGDGSAPVGGGMDLLIEQAHGGSPAALGQLLVGCQKYLLLVANRALDSDLRPKGGASDLVQDTFLAAHHDFSHFQGKTEQELLAWLTKILTNRLSNNVRRYHHTQKHNVAREVAMGTGLVLGHLNLPQPNAEPDQAILARNDAEQLQEAMGRLPEHFREVLVLRTWERRSFVEIATRLRSTPDSVRKLWGRAVRRLQVEFHERP